MLIRQPQDVLQKAMEVQMHCQLRKVNLHSCDTSIETLRDDLKAPFRLKIAFTTHAHGITEQTLRIEVGFTFNSFDSSDQPVPVFKFKCSFDLLYELREGYTPSEEEIDAFKDGNAVFNCWPYAREFVQSLTTRMGFQPPPLPLLRVAPKSVRTQTDQAGRVLASVSGTEPVVPESLD